MKLKTYGLCLYILIHAKLISSKVAFTQMTWDADMTETRCHKTYYGHANSSSVCRHYEKVTVHMRTRQLLNTIPVPRTSMMSNLISL